MIIQSATGASRVTELGVLQKLWSGYGSIVRYAVEGTDIGSVVVKHVSPPQSGNHPRGWNTDRSHQRKLKSYSVETVWYREFAARCDTACRVPRASAVKTAGNEVVMVLEDLDAAGFSLRMSQLTESQLAACLDWLANFHATFLGVAPTGLWPNGTYWHLETRPDELEVLAQQDHALYEAASAIDAHLQASAYQTLVHGDAKLANFCFADSGNGVAAVDFQYVGRGIGVKDLAYFMGSCLSEAECEQNERRLLEHYFSALREALIRKGSSVDLDALESDWRRLYPLAWTDFHRFLKGWSPGHWKINTYSERLAAEVVAQLNIGSRCS